MAASIPEFEQKCKSSVAGILHSSSPDYLFVTKSRNACRALHSATLPILLLIVLVQSGCVSRRLIVNSNPPGAMVLLEGREIGYTPTGVDFTYYGTRELTLIKDGYETKTQLVPVRPPWYQWPVIEFFSDNLLFGHVTDRRSVQIEMEPKQMVPNQELLNRGQNLRNESQIGK